MSKRSGRCAGLAAAGVSRRCWWRRRSRRRRPEPGRQVFAALRGLPRHEGPAASSGPSIVARIPLRNDQELEAVIREGCPARACRRSRTCRGPRPPTSSRSCARCAPRATPGRRRTTVTLADGRHARGRRPQPEPGRAADARRRPGGAPAARERAGGRYREVTSQTDWPTYNGHANGNRYSPLAQITAANAARLRPSGSSRCPTRRNCRSRRWSSTA